jgi:4-hydroxybenzoate polyprenyltransferase
MPFLPYARLLRLPNVFTAFADIALGACAAGSFSTAPIDGSFILRAAILFLASGSLYLAGMVWNDYFDFEEDRRDRPFRPLPSGQIAVRNAVRIGVFLLALGLAAAAASGFAGEGWRPDGAFIGGILCLAILAYDARIKRTKAGPLGMAA